MIKLSKKQLKEEAIYNEAYYFTGNVYSYENVIYYLESLCYYKNKCNTEEIEKNIYNNSSKNYYNSINDLIENIKNIDYTDYKIEKIAYSAGVYGNSGQLHTLKLYNNNNIVALYYMYY